LFFGFTQLLNLQIGFTYYLIFWELISPTDPIAVFGILATVNVPKKLNKPLLVESLFNDGIGVVIFTALLDTLK